MKSLFHPPSVLFGCDHLSVTHTLPEKDDKLPTTSHVSFNTPTIKMFTPLIPPDAHEPSMQKVKKPVSG